VQKPEHAPEVIVRSTFRNAAGRPCRVIEEIVTIEGKKVRASGTVCRQRDGRWVLRR
jgi:surface antigen